MRKHMKQTRRRKVNRMMTRTMSLKMSQTLEEAVSEALKQIEEKGYATDLKDAGIGPERIKKYGFAFEGKKVLIGES